MDEKPNHLVSVFVESVPILREDGWVIVGVTYDYATTPPIPRYVMANPRLAGYMSIGEQK